jgi:hypothetical protein
LSCPCQNNDILTEEINWKITEAEIRKAIETLKNSKAPGIDNIINEQIASSSNTMISVYCKLFNVIFDTGLIPESWTIGVIKQIYKNIGDPSLPENYRPISPLSCFWQTFYMHFE